MDLNEGSAKTIVSSALLATAIATAVASNYMGAGGPPHRSLERIRSEHPLSLHGVCMSIGGPQPLDGEHLGRFCALLERYEPALISEHLAWSTHQSTFFNDLPAPALHGGHA
jgi:uncharacterized protein (UPF0276 family)